MSAVDDVAIRRVRPGDEEQIAEICYQTGFMGESVEGRFADKELFGLIFAHSCLTFAPESCFVAEVDATVVGYCFVIVDTIGYERWVDQKHKKTIVRHAISKTLWRSPSDVLQLLRWTKAAGHNRIEVALEVYPAHLHINILPGHQRRGIGLKLLAAAFQHLKEKRTRGVHLRTSSRNTSALKFYERAGFVPLGSSDGNLWRVPGVKSVCMGLRFDAER